MESTSKSSGLLTADGVIATGKTILADVFINTDGTNAATLTLYDNASSASGTVLLKVSVLGADFSKAFNNMHCRADNGIFADISGAGADYVIHFK